jgi:hypothetical protein
MYTRAGRRQAASSRRGRLRSSFVRHHHVDLIGVNGRGVRDVVRIAQQQLQRVGARRQRQFDFRLAAAKVKMILVVWDRLVQGRQIRVD